MKTKLLPVLILLLLAVVRKGSAQEQLNNAPGTPLSITTTDELNLFYESASTVASALVSSANGGFPENTAFTATPGDMVLLTDPTGGNATTNWAAVMWFFNPADPTGTNGLAAIDDEAFFAANANNFLNFLLFSNTVYLPASVITSSNVDVTYEEVGPDGGLAAGQVDFITLDATPGPAPEPGTDSLLGLGGAVLLVGAAHRCRKAQEPN